MVANLMFDLPAVDVSTHTRSSGALWLGEVVATFGLAARDPRRRARRPRRRVAPFAVGGYIAAAYWFTSSTSFANPAVTIGRTLTDTFAGIAPSSVPDVHRHAGRSARSLAVALVLFLFPDVPATISSSPTTRTEPDVSTSRSAVPAVLFLCVHNAGRSQMALGWFDHLAGDRAVAWSAGSEPADERQPGGGRGDGRGRHRHRRRAAPSRGPTRSCGAADVVVTMGCGDACPFVPGKRYEDWELDDPPG